MFFLLLTTSFRMKTGLKNSYAPRVPLSGIFVRTRDLRTYFATVQPQIGQGNYFLNFFYFLCMDELSNQNRRKTFLKLPKGITSYDTFWRVFAKVNPEEFQNYFSEQ
jgi:hypothetical protein